jgi:histidinol-phosphate aminotransferase
MRTWLADRLAASGVRTDPSEANFILARFRDRAEAEACDATLRARGILVRKVAGYKLPQALRITVGDENACTQVTETIEEFIRVRA